VLFCRAALISAQAAFLFHRFVGSLASRVCASDDAMGLNAVIPINQWDEFLFWLRNSLYNLEVRIPAPEHGLSPGCFVSCRGIPLLVVCFRRLERGGEVVRKTAGPSCSAWPA